MKSSADMVKAAQAALHEPARKPSRRTAVVTCMDARVDPWRILRAGPGEIHVIRNAGGVVTDDVVRSILISQRTLDTNRVILMMHTDCAMEGLDGAKLAEAGMPDLLGFDNLEEELRRGAAALGSNPLIVGTVTAGIYNVARDTVTTVSV